MMQYGYLTYHDSKPLKLINMKNLIFNTSENWGATALRVTLGIVLFSHGAKALLGWFGGYGFSATMQFLQTNMSLPWLVAFVVICIQFFGAVMLFFGFGTRVAALGVFGIFIGMASYHVDFGFHMNWSGAKGGEGFEYHTLVLAMCVALLLYGGGALSIDRKIGATQSHE
jgi:putative oxidoreductase